MEDFSIIEDFGFTKEEVEAIRNKFLYSLDYSDFETMQIVDYELEDDDNHLNLPTGRLVHFPNNLVRKELYAQID